MHENLLSEFLYFKLYLIKAKCDAIAQNAMLLIDTYYRNVFNIEDFDQKVILNLYYLYIN